MRRRFLGLASLAAAAAAVLHGQACYQFSGSGVTLQITVVKINSVLGPADGVTTYTFSGTNTFTQGGATLTSSEIFVGAANIQYVSLGSAGVTTFEMVVPNADPNQTKGDHFWTVNLAGTGDLIPGSLLPAPAALPPLSAWTGVRNTNQITVSSGAARTDYPLSFDGACGSTNPGGGGTSATSSLQGLGDPSSIPGDCGCGEPISLGTGNVYYEVTDYKTAGPNQLALTRYYNSLASASGSSFAATLGPNWRTNYDRYLRLVSSTSVIAERPNGQQVTFTSNGSGWTTDSDIDLTLANSGSTWTLTDHQDNVETYVGSGANEAILQTIRARNGYTQTLQYASGNVLANVTDSYNRSLVFTVSSGLLQSLATPEATTVNYAFTSGTLTSAAYSTTPVTSQKYVYGNSSFPGALTGIVDENGATYLSWTYDSQGRALTSQHAGGADLTTIVYNDTDGSRTVSNALGETELYKFTTLQSIPKVTEVDRQAGGSVAAAVSKYTYDSNGYTSSYTDWNGNTTTYSNDAHGQPVSIVEAAGTPAARTTAITYLANFHLPSQIVTPGLTADFTYDGNGEVLTRKLTDTTSNSDPYSTNGQSRTWTYTYANSLMTSEKTPRTDANNLSTLTYDSSGALTSITDAVNHALQITSHTGGGLPLTILDSNGVTVKLTYDGRQRLLSTATTTSAGVLTTGYTYDAAGNLTGVTQPDGSALSATYDQAHRLTALTDLFNQKLTITLDALGDSTKRVWTNASGVTQRTNSAVFDALGRMLQATGGANQSTGYSYDSVGNMVKVTDPLNHATQGTFDALNRLTGTADAAGGQMAESFDAHNRPLSVGDPDGATTVFTYDGFGDLIQLVSPATGTTLLHYDADGNVTQRVDARGVVSNRTYDAAGRLTALTYPANSAENVTYTYDEPGHGFGIGRLTSLQDAAGTLAITYDERGNVLSETRVTGGATLQTSYTYDQSARITGITYPSKTAVTYSRDKMGRITQVTAQAPGGAVQTVVSGITYQPFGPVSGLKYGNGIAETRSFDQDYRMMKLASSGNTAAQSLTYSYDAGNNVTSIADGVTAANGQNLGYDVLNRLISASGGYGNLGYTYDANGNRTKETSPAAAQDGLGAITGFTYNQAGQLAAASSGTQQVAQYTYDADGQRIVKQTPASSTIYQYDPGRRLLEEANGQGVALSDYIYLDGRPVAVISQSTGGQVYFLHGDRLGTPQIATGNNQSPTWTASYQPFGALNSAASQTATLSQDLRLPGQVNDAETGLYQNGFRYYGAAWGRYLQSDLIGIAGGSNSYGYALGNPLLYSDPWGLCSISDLAKEALADAEQGVANAESAIQVQYAEEQAYGLSGYVQQLPWVSTVEADYQKYVAPYLPAALDAHDFYSDASGAAEGDFLGIVGIETRILRAFFGPLPTYTIDPITHQVTITPAKK